MAQKLIRFEVTMEIETEDWEGDIPPAGALQIFLEHHFITTETHIAIHEVKDVVEVPEGPQHISMVGYENDCNS